jgi:hypothetical protein
VPGITEHSAGRHSLRRIKMKGIYLPTRRFPSVQVFKASGPVTRASESKVCSRVKVTDDASPAKDHYAPRSDERETESGSVARAGSVA